jgi:ParB family chromosome partitioning protein
MSDFYNNSIFWVEVDRISPNPYQPRKDFNDDKIAELADSIRQYGVLQPLVVTRQESERPDGGISVEYELIAGERRLRASKLAGVSQVPVIIRAQEQSNKMKLELAIIENLQREDLNAIDRAMAFKQLVDEFNLKHIEIAKKVGKSREYVSNTLRLLGLPDYIQAAVSSGQITEGHARPLLMLGDERAAERDTLFKEITTKKLTVRESERIARRIATEKQRKQDLPPELIKIEKGLTETLGTRVQIEQRSEKGGKVHIDFFSQDDLQRLLSMLAKHDAYSTEQNIEQEESVSPEVVNTTNTQEPAHINTDTNMATAISAEEALKRFNETFGSVEFDQNSTQIDTSVDTIDNKNPIDTTIDDTSFINNTEDVNTPDTATPEPLNPFAVMPSISDEQATDTPTQGDQQDDLYAIRSFSI